MLPGYSSSHSGKLLLLFVMQLLQLHCVGQADLPPLPASAEAAYIHIVVEQSCGAAGLAVPCLAPAAL